MPTSTPTAIAIVAPVERLLSFTLVTGLNLETDEQPAEVAW